MFKNVPQDQKNFKSIQIIYNRKSDKKRTRNCNKNKISRRKKIIKTKVLNLFMAGVDNECPL